MKHRSSTTLFPKPPFSFDGTVYVPHYFPTPDVNWKKGACWQTLNWRGEALGIKMENRGTTNRPRISLSVYSERRLVGREIKDVAGELGWRYGLEEDISEFCNQFKRDRFLEQPLKRLKGMRLSCGSSLYELLMIAIVLQNATVRRTVQMMNNLFNAHGTRLRFDSRELFAYWSPKDLADVTEEDLRRLKVGYRARMIKKISDGFSRGDIDEAKLRRMTKEDAEKELMKLYGVGPATVQNILGGYLRRYDTFDLKGRLWEEKILSRALFNKKLVPAQKITSLFERRYGKWRGLAFHYIFTDLFWGHKQNKIDWLEKEIRM
ncbi:MAG: hypothetical protein OEY99_02165 [Aigarchaeota archaeon]|nr:hypothetical protein [Aigarchaeota archaeon]